MSYEKDVLFNGSSISWLGYLAQRKICIPFGKCTANNSVLNFVFFLIKVGNTRDPVQMLCISPPKVVGLLVKQPQNVECRIYNHRINAFP